MRGSIDHMLSVAKKKPGLKEIVDNIVSYDDEKINSVQFPLWIKKRLIQYRDIEATKHRMQDLHIPAPKDTVHSLHGVYKYTGPTALINDDSINNGRMQYEVDCGDIFLICDEQYIKFNSMVVYCVGGDREQIVNNSKFIDNMLIAQYNELLQEALTEKHGGSVGGDSSSPYDYAASIRFY